MEIMNQEILKKETWKCDSEDGGSYLWRRPSGSLKPNDESEILQQLKEKFHSTAENSVKV